MIPSPPEDDEEEGRENLISILGGGLYRPLQFYQGSDKMT